MSFVIGRDSSLEDGPVGRLGVYRALDGSEGAPIYMDINGPHAMLIVGKRGYGKSYTLGVVAEFLSRFDGVAPIIIDPMDVFRTLTEPATEESVPATVIDDPVIVPSSLEPRSWCALLDLSPESAAGALVWQAAEAERSIGAMIGHVESTEAPMMDKRSAINHLSLADSWGIFDVSGLTAADLSGPEISVINVSGLESAPMNAVTRGIAEALYTARVHETTDRLPWLLLDEAHTFFNGLAAPALETVLTRGRAPGVSLVMATQRPSAVSDTAISQSDLLVSHRLTSHEDLAALEKAQPTYMDTSIDERMPTNTGEVVVIDDATETVHSVQVRRRETPHGGDSPLATDLLETTTT